MSEEPKKASTNVDSSEEEGQIVDDDDEDPVSPDNLQKNEK